MSLKQAKKLKKQLTDKQAAMWARLKYNEANTVLTGINNFNANGVSTHFTLPFKPVSSVNVVTINGVQQQELTDFKVIGGSIVFNYAPRVGDTIEVHTYKQ